VSNVRITANSVVAIRVGLEALAAIEVDGELRVFNRSKTICRESLRAAHDLGALSSRPFQGVFGFASGLPHELCRVGLCTP
jgi:hypothetical protein